MEELHTCRIDGGGSPNIGQVTWWGEDALQQKYLLTRPSLTLRVP